MPDDTHPAPDAGTRILWSRVALLVLVLIGAFLLGRWSAGDDGAAELALEESQARVTELRERVSDLEAQLEARAAGGAQGPDGPSPEQGPPDTPPAGQDVEEASPATTPSPQAATRSYEVQPGDTLISIAEQVYGSADEWERIAEANDLSGENALTVGSVLEIPPAE